MSLWVDGNLVDSTPLSQSELHNRISALRVKIDTGGRLVRCITVGDQTYWDESDVPDPGTQDIHVQTCTYQEYVDEVAEDLSSFSAQLVDQLELSAVSWSSGDDHEAFAAFAKATNGINWVLQAGSNLYQYKHPESNLAEWAPFHKLRYQIEVISSLLGQKDSVEIADAVRYELIPVIRTFVENVTSP